MELRCCRLLQELFTTEDTEDTEIFGKTMWKQHMLEIRHRLANAFSYFPSLVLPFSACQFIN